MAGQKYREDQMNDWFKLATLFFKGIIVSGTAGIIIFLLWRIMVELYKDLGIVGVWCFVGIVGVLMVLLFEEMRG